MIWQEKSKPSMHVRWPLQTQPETCLEIVQTFPRKVSINWEIISETGFTRWVACDTVQAWKDKHQKLSTQFQQSITHSTSGSTYGLVNIGLFQENHWKHCTHGRMSQVINCHIFYLHCSIFVFLKFSVSYMLVVLNNKTWNKVFKKFIHRWFVHRCSWRDSGVWNGP